VASSGVALVAMQCSGDVRVCRWPEVVDEESETDSM
jgi:hypothetical protein